MTKPSKDEIITFLKELRSSIRHSFELHEPSKRFSQKNWDHPSGGGGEISLLRGDIFEKAAVNFSAVKGEKFPMGDAEGPFFATGVSLITHMKNPHVPTVHMNIRYIEVGDKWWLGGGYDLTPMGHFYEEDTHHFHEVARSSVGNRYEEFSENAKKYFYIPHRKKERGIGGLFFDHYNTGNCAEDFSMWKRVGTTFTDAILPIILKRKDTPYTEDDIRIQNEWRAHYVEFNLLYDRGTKFGFNSGGNPDAILCSMPPNASW